MEGWRLAITYRSRRMRRMGSSWTWRRRRRPTTARNYCLRWIAWKSGSRKNRNKWWRMGATPRGRPSRRWPSEMSSGATAPNRIPPSAFLYQPETNRYVCPEGKLLRPQGRHNNKKQKGLVAYRYEAKISDCQNCARKPECCPANHSQGRGLLRREESATVLAFREKMANEEAQVQYRRRSQIAEFCHAWIKSKLGCSAPDFFDTGLSVFMRRLRAQAAAAEPVAA